MLDADARLNLTNQMARLADGDRSAFDAVYSALWPLVSAFCAKTLPPTDAEDAAQAALLKVFERALSFDRNRDALTWAFAIAAWETKTVRQRFARVQGQLIRAITSPKFWGRVQRGRFTTTSARSSSSGTRFTFRVNQETLMATFNEESSDAALGTTLRKRRQRALFRFKEAWRSIYGN